MVVEQRARDQAAEEGSAEEAKRTQPDNTDQYNFTDPESRIMKSGDGCRATMRTRR